MTSTFPFRPVTNKVCPPPKPKPGQRCDGPSLFGKAWATLPVWPAVVLLFALSGCSLFFPRGPYTRIPDLSSPMTSAVSEPMKGDSTGLDLRSPAFRFDAPKRTDFAPTPGGERRYIRAIRAATPRKVKGAGAVYAPHNSGTVAPTVATAKNAVAAAKDAVVVSAPNADNAAGPGAVQTNTESRGLSWLWLLLIPTGIAARWAFNRLTS